MVNARQKNRHTVSLSDFVLPNLKKSIYIYKVVFKPTLVINVNIYKDNTLVLNSIL